MLVYTHPSNEVQLYITTGLGRLVRITAITDSVADANATDQSVIAEVGPFIFLADERDKGIPFPRERS